MSLRVLKWNVPVDDKPHEIGGGHVLLVACQHGPESVQVWTVELDEPRTLLAQVFGTGQPLPGSVQAHVGSAVTAGGELVWHVFEVRP